MNVGKGSRQIGLVPSEDGLALRVRAICTVFCLGLVLAFCEPSKACEMLGRAWVGGRVILLRWSHFSGLFTSDLLGTDTVRGNPTV